MQAVDDIGKFPKDDQHAGLGKTRGILQDIVVVPVLQPRIDALAAQGKFEDRG